MATMEANANTFMQGTQNVSGAVKLQGSSTVVAEEYKVFPFNPRKAEKGALCVMIKQGSVSDGNVISSVKLVSGDDNYDANGRYHQVNNLAYHAVSYLNNPNFGGAGVCKPMANDTYQFTVKSKTYVFNWQGNPMDKYFNDEGYEENWVLKLAQIVVPITTSGNAAYALSKSKVMRTGEDTAEVGMDYSKTVMDVPLPISDLNPRDHFAAQALRGMLSHIEDPSSLSVDAMNYYCNAAYKWAANMMQASASARGAYLDATAKKEDPEPVAVGILDDNSDKLLNNLIVALQRTDYTYGEHWTDSAGNVVYKGNSNEDVQNLDGNHYNNVDEALQDGWSFTPTEYAERVINIELNEAMKVLHEDMDKVHTDLGTTIHGDMTTANTHLQGIKAGVGGSNAVGDNVVAKLDGIKTGVGGSSTTGDNVVAKLDNIKASLGGGTGRSDTVVDMMSTLNTSMGGSSASGNNVVSKLDSIATQISNISGGSTAQAIEDLTDVIKDSGDSGTVVSHLATIASNLQNQWTRADIEAIVADAINSWMVYHTTNISVTNNDDSSTIRCYAIDHLS